GIRDLIVTGVQTCALPICVTVFEALKAYDQLKAAGTAIRVIDLYSVAPVDAAALVRAGRATGGRLITVEDHYAGGGIGDAVAAEIGRASCRERVWIWGGGG